MAQKSQPITISDTPTPSTGARIVRWVLYTIVVAAVSIGMLFLFWVLQTGQVLEVKEINGSKDFPIRPPVVAQEEVIYLHVNFCKKADIEGTVIARLVGKKSIIRLPYPAEKSRPGCVDTEAPIPIPAYATDDTYHFEFDVTYEINPIKKQSITLRSQEFTVQAKQ